MIINQNNFTTIATKFLKAIEPDNGIPCYIDVWPEFNVTAVRLIIEGNINYSLRIDGEEICMIEGQVSLDNKFYIDKPEAIVDKLFKGVDKYVDLTIQRDVDSIVNAVSDFRFTCSLLPGNLNANVHTVETKDGNKTFIDIHRRNTILYSAPHSVGYEEIMRQTLAKVLKDNYKSGDLLVNIP